MTSLYRKPIDDHFFELVPENQPVTLSPQVDAGPYLKASSLSLAFTLQVWQEQINNIDWWKTSETFCQYSDKNTKGKQGGRI